MGRCLLFLHPNSHERGSYVYYYDKPTTTIDPCQSDSSSLAPTLETHEGNAENIDSTGKGVDDYKDNMGRSNGVLMSPDMSVAEPDDLGDLPPPPMMLLSPS